MKAILLVVVALLVALLQVEADFMYNRILPKEDQLADLGLKCIPGRTVIRIEERKIVEENESDESEEEHEIRRTHMNAVPKDENCQICVCSVEGKDEYCSRRPARNVNECLRMSMLKDELAKNKPYSHERSLAYRIRRDYIWHDDEIPYDSKASCRRGRSYYSNSITANDTDIDVGSDVDSLLDYSNKDICFYCVCSLDGKNAGCISRDPVFCEYYRIIRNPDAARNEYRTLFKQDRPAYFRQLSYRLRRKMDEGLFDLTENVGSGLDDSKCVPHVSQYSDCTDANACSGCTRCSCNDKGDWECQDVIECPQEDGTSMVDDTILENALEVLYEGMENKVRGPGKLVPPPPNPNDDLLLVSDKRAELEKEMRMLMDGRQKRSVDEGYKHNATVKFYETVDEVNEDTLKDSNSSGTIEAHKFKAREVGKNSRRVLENNNASSNDLHIEYSKPHKLEHHIAENKVDSKHPTEDKINGLSHEEIHKILGNYSEITKNKELSKLVVNELTRGTERIGDKNVVPVSNITFTPENDTLTAMTFIAGNLLNKLWDMEKDAREGSYETEVMKHEKINDLLELFREPLSLRQENFLKNALEKLSRVIDTNTDTRNMSLCANIEENSETIEPDNRNCTEESKSMKGHVSTEDTKIKKANIENKSKATNNAISKIDEVLNLMKKYEELQAKVNNIKNIPESNVKKPIARQKNMSMGEDKSLNLFGKVLDKITNLLSPNKNNKNLNKKLGTYNMLRKDDIAKKNVEKMFNINLSSTEFGAKDRMITDYLRNIEIHPNCFFNHLKKPVVTPLSNIEGSILYNLSEFFKIKSFTDFLNVVSEKENTNKTREHHNTTLNENTNDITISKQNKATTPVLRINRKPKNGSLESVKEKLKNDIKNILQDLYALQKEHGIKTRSNINIADALPCIYNILNVDSHIDYDNSESNTASTFNKKLSALIDSLKQDMKLMSPSRRSNLNVLPRPKSAIVWERTIKDLNKKYVKSSRRSLDEIPKTLRELREMMEKVELSSNSYKNFAIKEGIAPSERLIFLKTLYADIKQYINVLEAIKNSFTTVTNLPSDKQKEILEFIDNAAMNINLNKKLIDLVTKVKSKRSDNRKTNIVNDSNQPLIMMPKWVEANENNNFKLKRDQIITQLIMNRLRLYIKTKERSEFDLNENANYNIAKRILFHLENGNIALAKELYKVFLENKQQHSSKGLTKFREYRDRESFETNEKSESAKLKPIFMEPLVSDEDVRKIKMLTQDYFLKQLWNLKELKE